MNVLTGNVWFDQTDGVVPGVGPDLQFVRSYNSLNAGSGIGGSFGPGWTHTYERSLSFPHADTIELLQSDGIPLYFEDWDVDLTFAPWLPATERSSIVKSGTTYVRALQGGGSETYDSAGRLVSLADASGNTTTLERDSSGKLTGVVDPGARALSFSYGGAGNLSSVAGPLGTLAAYTHDAGGRLASASYPDGSGFQFAYDTGGRLVTVTDASGRTLETHTYDGAANGLTSEIAAGQERLTFAYYDGRTEVTDALGRLTTHTWREFDGLRRLTKVDGPCAECGGGSQVQEWTYDDKARPTSHKDGLGSVTTYVYDAAGNQTSETNALSQTMNFTYDSQGRVLTRSGPDGSLTTYTHGAAGPLTITEKVTATQNRTTTIAYNGQGKSTSITDPRGKVTALAYNSSGDLTSVTDPLTHATSFGYDTMGRRTTVTSPLNHTTTTAYDARGRVIRTTNPDATHTDFAYDLGGRRTSVTDPLGRTTYYAYDAYGRLEKVLDSLNGVTRYAYDLMSNLTSLTDAKGQVTTFEYDGYNRVKKVIYPGGGQETFTYDAAGRLATKTDRKNVVTTYTYDVLGRLTGKTYSDGTTPAVTYTFDLGGRLATAANGTDTLTWAYDLAGQLLSEQSSKNASTVAYTYDLGANRLNVSLDGQLFVSYAYDDASRPTTITRGTNAFGFGYDNANRRTSMTYPNGVNTSYTYDTLSRLTNLTAVKNPTTITNFTYTYDNAGNRLSKQQLDFTENYTYDKLYRLATVDRTGGSTGRWLYGYDAVGNRLSEQIGDTVSSSTHNSKNQLLSATGGGPLRWRGTLNEPGNVTFTTVTVNGQPARMLAGNVFEANLQMAAGNNTVTVQATDTSGNVTTKNYQVNVTGSGATYTYDLNGNLTQKVEGADTWGYEWNPENQLIRVTKNAVEQARFKYDPRGRRVEKAAGGVATTYTYDGEDILRELGGATTVKYVQGPGIDEPLATDDGTALSYFHADGLGSVLRITNSVGVVTLTRLYDASGNLQTGATTPGYSFTGREWDPETGLYYYRARYYDPKGGRFLSEDPIGFLGGTVNLYGYVDDNPTNFFDPFGLVKTGGKVKDPVNTIVCDGAGNIVVHIQPLDPEAIECGILTCLIVHETSHKNDAERANPDVCKTSKGFVPADTEVVPSNEGERVTGEGRATPAEEECLRNKQKGCSPRCNRRIERRMNTLDCFRKNNFKPCPPQ